MREAKRFVVAAVASACAACSLLFGVSDDVASGKRTSDEASVDAAAVDSAGDEVVAAPIPCPTATEGPVLVRAGSFCIDSTEVTVAHYQRFLEAGVPPFVDAVQCATNTTSNLERVNDAEPPADRPAFVDYCDAVAFCLWAGKRLCGGLNGGRADASGADRVFENQWAAACRGPNALLYPYGNDPVPDACPPPLVFSSTVPYDEAAPVGSHPRCEGAFPGLFDMVGNGLEWVDACMSNVACGTLGAYDCVETGGRLVSAQAAFRCCAP